MSTRRAAASLLRVSTRTRFQPNALAGRARTLLIPQTPRAAHLYAGSIRAYSQSVPENKTWKFEEVQKLAQTTKSNVTIIDVREPGELQQTGHIPHAVNVPITSYPDSFHISAEEFEDRFGFPRPEKEAEVVFYCKSGVRSRGAAGIARDAGWKKVGEYPGSWTEWFGKGGEVER